MIPTYPLFLIAALAAAIPVVLHMISRQKARDLPFPTLRFLQISVEKTRRRKRVQDVLLMLLRMAVLILIAVGLSELKVSDLPELLGGGQESAVAIILDNSASMGSVDEGRVRFRTALSAADQIMEQLRAGDRVALFLTGGPNSPESGKLDRTHEKVRQILNQWIVAPSDISGVSYEPADLGDKIRQARRILVESGVDNKQIYVLTDMQELSWESLAQRDDAGEQAASKNGPSPPALPSSDSSTKEEEGTDRLDIPVILVDCNRAPEPNVAVGDVSLEAAVPVAGVPIKASVELLNASEVAQQRHLELHIDGAKEKTSEALKIPPGSTLRHDFLFEFKRGGLHLGEVRLVGRDGSKMDDRRFFTMEVDQGIPVAIVKATHHEVPYLEDTFYVEQALSPGRSGGWALRTTTLLAGDLTGEPLAAYKVIFLVNLPALEAATAERLRAYVAGGGNLVWICGDNVEPEAYNLMDQQAGGQLLPAPLLDVRAPGVGDDRDSWSITFLDKTHRALSHLVEPASLYQSVLIYRHVRLDADAVPAAWVMARLDDGEPLLVERKIEEGKVLMLGTSAHVGWSNMPLRPIFLPLLVRLTFELAGMQKARHRVLAGRPLVLPLDDATRPVNVQVNPPSGETLQLGSRPAGGAKGQEFRYADTHQIGIYKLRPLEGPASRPIAYSVNVDPDEADQSKIDRQELQKRLGPAPLVVADDPDDLSSTFAQLREGKSLWELFLVGVLIVLVFETFVSNRLSPKHDEDQGAQPPPGMRRLARKGRAGGASS